MCHNASCTGSSNGGAENNGRDYTEEDYNPPKNYDDFDYYAIAATNFFVYYNNSIPSGAEVPSLAGEDPMRSVENDICVNCGYADPSNTLGFQDQSGVSTLADGLGVINDGLEYFLMGCMAGLYGDLSICPDFITSPGVTVAVVAELQFESGPPVTFSSYDPLGLVIANNTNTLISVEYSVISGNSRVDYGVEYVGPGDILSVPLSVGSTTPSTITRIDFNVTLATNSYTTRREFGSMSLIPGAGVFEYAK